MLGSYPSLSLHDPETYIAVICSLLSGYPLWAGSTALERAACSGDCKFIPPTPGILKPYLEDQVRTARYVQRWDAQSEQQLLPPPPGPSDAQRSAHLAALREKHGPTFGIAGGRKRPQTREEARADLMTRIGQEAFDAIPEIGAEGWRTAGEVAAKMAADQ